MVYTYSALGPALECPAPDHRAHIHFHSQPLSLVIGSTTHSDLTSKALSLPAKIRFYLDSTMTI